MSGTPINLNRARKERARAAQRKAADANAVKHGRTKAEKQLEDARVEKEARRLDQHRREEE